MPLCWGSFVTPPYRSALNDAANTTLRLFTTPSLGSKKPFFGTLGLSSQVWVIHAALQQRLTLLKINLTPVKHVSPAISVDTLSLRVDTCGWVNFNHQVLLSPQPHKIYKKEETYVALHFTKVRSA
jgi:hypothetical protein